MATYTKETALYDTGAISSGISDASKTASNYLTNITSGGVYVHSADTSSDPTAATAKGVKITDQIDIIQGGNSVATFGSTVTVGGQGGTQAIIDSGSFIIKKPSENFSISLIPTSGNDNGGAVVFGEGGGAADTFIIGASSATDGFMQLGSGSNLLTIATGSLSNSIRASVGNSYISVQASTIGLVSNNGNGNVSIDGDALINNGKYLRLNSGVGSSYSWNQIWSDTYNNTSNLYLQADGYMGFYVGNTTTAPAGKMYLYTDHLALDGYYACGGRKIITKAEKSADNISISGNSQNTSVSFSVASSGWTPIGILGWSFTNATSSGAGAYYVVPVRIRISGNNVVATIRNNSSSNAKVKLTVDVLYVSNAQGV